MGKSVHNNILDAALNYLKTNGNKLCVCSAEPTTYAEATTLYDGGASKYEIADVVIDSDDYTGPAEGDTSGRKITVNQQSDMDVDATATATHIAIVDTVNENLLYVTTCTSQSLTSGNKVTVPAWDIELRDPS